MNSKKIIIAIIAVVLLAGLIVVGYLQWKKSKEASGALEKAGQAADILTDTATKGVLPSLQTNPLENKPDVNPADRANPLKNIKINPFE